jgi:hypothetical protein
MYGKLHIYFVEPEHPEKTTREEFNLTHFIAAL